jgi:alkylation response protein AidB-like acyl-CoA dehydrogenase
MNIAGQVEFNEVFLTDVRVPDLHRISPVGEGWAAAQTTLGAERFVLSGARKKRKASDEILGGKTIEQVIELARLTGVTGDAIWRQRIAIEWTKQRLLQLSALRTKANAASGRAGPEGSVSKIAKATANQSLQVLAIDILGAAATGWPSDDPEPRSFVEQFLRTRANSIEGGTSEIQRNIVGERVLGLPREPDPYRGEPWNLVPRS